MPYFILQPGRQAGVHIGHAPGQGQINCPRKIAGAPGLPRQILAWFTSRFPSRVAGVGDRRATPPGPWRALWGLVPARQRFCRAY
jgi:hypothetical protein